jgi:tripartite-type tricarboxylate transporter receptor subunit TctC
VQIFFDNPVASAPMVKAGRLKAIAVTQRTPLLPATPTLDEAGLKGFDHGFWYGIVAPAGTPRAIADSVSREIAAYGKSSAGRNELAALAVEPVGSTPEQFTAIIRNDIDRWGKVARAIGLKPQ